MYRYTVLYYAKVLMRRYQHQKKQLRRMEKAFKRMEGIWNIKIDTDNFKVEDMSGEKLKPLQPSS